MNINIRQWVSSIPLPSHGRGHRFNPCRAHQNQALSGPLGNLWRGIGALILLIALPAPALAEPLPDHLSRAASCAASLMDAEPVLPDRYLDRVPGKAFCEAGGREACSGTFFTIRGQTYIVAPSGAFETLVHEACHAIQWGAGKRLSEPECEAVEAWAWSCP